MLIPAFAASATADEIVEAIRLAGGAVIEGVIAADRLSALTDELADLVGASPVGMRSFDGSRTRRVFDPLARTRSLDDVVTNDVVRSVVSALLPWPHQFGMTILSQLLPGQER